MSGISARPPVRVLHVGPQAESVELASLLAGTSSPADYVVKVVPDYSHGLKCLLSDDFDVAVVENCLEHGRGLDLIRKATGAGCQVPLVFLAEPANRSGGGESAPPTELEAFVAGAAWLLRPDALARPEECERLLRCLGSTQRSQQERLAGWLDHLSTYLQREGKNATTGIVGVVDVLASRLNEGEWDLREEIGARLNDLIENFRLLSLLFGVPIPAVRDVRLKDLLRKYGEVASTAGVTLEIVGPDVVLSADPAQLRSLFEPLLLNAREAMPAGGVIRALVGVEGATCRVRIEDQGEGVLAEQVGRMFQPFFTTKRHALGLGLPIARRIAEAHRGSLSAEVSPQGAVVVEVTLPLRETSRSWASNSSRLVG